MAFITNGGARLIERARLEGKSIVFGSVRMNTVYESNPSELVQHREAWFGEPVGAVIGCLSHVTVDGSSHVCDAKIAIQCDDSKPWKSIGVYAHIEGEDSGETLLACESIQNGDYKNVTVIELPVTLDGAVADFGLSEGGSGGGGGGGDVPANVMTTDTNQTGLSGMKQWELRLYRGEASAESPNVGDALNVTHVNIGDLSYYNVDNRPVSYPIHLSNETQIYDGYFWGEGRPSYAKLSPLGILELNSGIIPEGEGFRIGESLIITADGVDYTNPEERSSSATWNNIINAANGGSGGGGGDVPANMMTTDTNQEGLTGMKQWSWELYGGDPGLGGSLEEPNDGDLKTRVKFSISRVDEWSHTPITFESEQYIYVEKEGIWSLNSERRLNITPDGVSLDSSGRWTSTSWSNIINTARNESMFSHASIRQDEGGGVSISNDYNANVQIEPNTTYKIDAYALLVINEEGQISAVRTEGGVVMDISAAVYESHSGTMHRVSGISANESDLSFESPITPAEGQEVYVHWTRMA